MFLFLYSGLGVCVSPFFVLASDTCYVDEDADDDGDGSDDEPYKSIEKALNKDCARIIVASGTYDDTITIGKNVAVEGKSRDSVKITAAVTLKDGAALSGVTVSGNGGVAVDEDAEIEIEDATITGADIGIETVAGSGKVTVKDTKITDGNKGLYLQSGNTVKITGCEIYDNDEEGIDIRSNVDGVISNNTISGNGESGIEVILGKADLQITGNKIKKNGASGIATQYYKGTGKSGAVKIKNNTITDNKQFGMNCKTPSGGNPGKEFWGETLNMSSNKLSGNKDGDFAPDCSLSETAVADASMTQKQKDEAAAKKVSEEQEAARLLAEKQKLTQTQTQKQIDEEAARQAAEEAEQAALRENLQKNNEQKEIIHRSLETMQNTYDTDVAAVESACSRNAFVMFLIGPRKKDLQQIESNAAIYAEQAHIAQTALASMTDQTDRTVLNAQVKDLVEKREELQNFVEQQKKEFSMFGWIFN